MLCDLGGCYAGITRDRRGRLGIPCGARGGPASIGLTAYASPCPCELGKPNKVNMIVTTKIRWEMQVNKYSEYNRCVIV